MRLEFKTVAPVLVLLTFAVVFSFFSQNLPAAETELEASALTFNILGLNEGSFVLAAEQGDPSAVYDLNSASFSFSTFDFVESHSLGAIETPLFCFDFPTEDSGQSNQLVLNVTNSSGHLILAGIPLVTDLRYRLSSQTLEFSPGEQTQCFYIGDNDGATFGLFGEAPPERMPTDPEPDPDRVFLDSFELFVNPGLDIRFLGVPQVIASGRTLSYSMEVENIGDVVLSDLAFQEIFPQNIQVFPAVLGTGSWSCIGERCPVSSGSGLIRFSGVELEAGESLRFQIERPVSARASEGSQITLYAGVVNGPGLNAEFSADQAEVAVAGTPVKLVFRPLTEPIVVGQTSTLTVEVQDAKGNRIPGDGRTIELLKVGGVGPGDVLLPSNPIIGLSDGRAEFEIRGEAPGAVRLIARSLTGSQVDAGQLEFTVESSPPGN